MPGQKSMSDGCKLNPLKSKSNWRRNMNDELSAERLREITNKMVDAISSPAYVEAMRAVKSAPEGQRLDEAMRRLAPDVLRAQGVPLPEGMRISSRYFEKGYSPIEVGELPEGQRNLLKELNEREPGVLDRLRRRDPQFLDNLADLLQPAQFSPVALCGCAGGGAATVCGCAGGG
jgi:hypothetical protein